MAIDLTRPYTKQTEQEMQNQGFDPVTGLPVVQIATYDGQNVQRGTGAFAEIADTTSTSGYVYEGKAAPGSAQSGAVWQIKRTNLSTLTSDYPNGSAGFSNIWNNRTSLTYL